MFAKIRSLTGRVRRACRSRDSHDESNVAQSQPSPFSLSTLFHLVSQKLNNYTDGANASGLPINETLPTTIGIKATPGPFGERVYTISKFAPLAYEGAPPAPIDPEVTITQLPAFKAYVNATAGFKMDEFSIAAMAARLVQDVQLNEGIVLGGDYTFAAYDNFTITATLRHNEVWIIAPATQTNAIESQ